MLPINSKSSFFLHNNLQTLENDIYENIQVVHLPTTPKLENNSLWTNQSCVLCEIYSHHSHHCLDLSQYKYVLDNLHHLSV